MRTFFEAQSYKFIKEYLSLLKIKYEQIRQIFNIYNRIYVFIVAGGKESSD